MVQSGVVTRVESLPYVTHALGIDISSENTQLLYVCDQNSKV